MSFLITADQSFFFLLTASSLNNYGLTMMPPKKSKAARAKALVEAYDDVKSENSDTEEKNETKLLITDKSPDEEKEGDTVNVFKVEIIDGKRKRNLPASEGKLGEWYETVFF